MAADVREDRSEVDHNNCVSYQRNAGEALHIRDIRGNHLLLLPHSTSGSGFASKQSRSGRWPGDRYGRFSREPESNALVIWKDDQDPHNKLIQEDLDIHLAQDAGEYRVAAASVENGRYGKRGKHQGMAELEEALTGAEELFDAGVKNATALAYNQIFRADTADALDQRMVDRHKFALQLNIGYEYCHLIAARRGGEGGPQNVVLGTRHCNSEQLCLEEVLEEYKNEGFEFHVIAKIINGTDVIPSDILFRVVLGGNLAYYRSIDPSRLSVICDVEHDLIQQQMRHCLNQALLVHYGIKDAIFR